MALLPPLPAEEWDDKTRAAFIGMLARDRQNPEGAGTALSALAHHPDLTKAFLGFSVYLLWRSTLPPRLRELAILRRKCPRAPESLAREIVAFTQKLRTMDLFKAPGVAETLDWAEALVALDRIALDPAVVADTVGVLLKYQDDVGAITPAVAAKLVADAQESGIRL